MRSKKSIMGVIGLVLITGMIFMGCDSGTNSDTTEPQPNGIRITGAEEGSDFTVVVFEQSITYAAMTGGTQPVASKTPLTTEQLSEGFGLLTADNNPGETTGTFDVVLVKGTSSFKIKRNVSFSNNGWPIVLFTDFTTFN